MEFLMFVVDDPTAEPYVEAEDNIVEWVAELDERGMDVKGDRLRPASDARTIRIRDGKTIVTTGPFTESREVIAGYGVINAADLAEAIEVSSRHPMARFGRIELRPVWPFTGED
jgi:hypothetical protein